MISRSGTKPLYTERPWYRIGDLRTLIQDWNNIPKEEETDSQMRDLYSL